MRRSLISIRLVAVLLGLAPAAGAAQDIGGNLDGAVIDSAGRSLSGVEVLVDGTGLPGTRITQTSQNGHFRLDQVPVGIYRVRYRLVGYQPAALAPLVVRLGTTTSVPSVTLTASAFALAEITVSAERPLLDPTSAAGGGTLTAEHFDELPTDRNYRNLPLFLPGVTEEVEGINVEGATGPENQFYVDGANVTDMGVGSTSMGLPPNFVQEVRVRSGGYEAEYRGALGGVVDVVTRSGGDRFEGQVFGTATGNGLTGTPRTAELGTSPGGFARYDLGGSLGGPIRRGRIWFFGAYGRFTEREETVVPGYESPDARRVHNAFAAKFTWQPSSRTTVITSLLGDPTTERTAGAWGGGIANLDPLLGDAKTGFFTGTINVAHTVSSRVTLNASASWVRQRYYVTGSTERGRNELWFADSNDVLSGGYYARGGSHDTRLTGILSASYLAGAHQLKAGVEYVAQRLDEAYLELNGFHNRPQPPDHPTDFYQLFTDDVLGRTESRLPAVYAQDGWSPDRHVTLNAGLRWDGQYLIGSDGHVSLAIKDQWQPRVGIVLRPDEAGRQRVFASWGRFYQEIHQTLGSVYYAYGSRFGVGDCTTDPRVDSTTCGPPTQSFSRVPDPRLEGQSFDEWSAGYERALSGRLTGRVRVVGRRFNWGIEDGRLHNTGDIVLGNPGRGELSDYPKMRRDYTAVELCLDGAMTPRLWVLTSYVLSRTYGNYTGLYNSDEGQIFPNINGAFDNQDILVNGTGLLPNDRTHVFKLNAAYRFLAGITAGTAFVVQSGTPRNILAPIVTRPHRNGFLVPRGMAGRTPTVWDLNLRLAWSADAVLRTGWQPSLVLDLYHVASRRQALAYDELKYEAVDSLGNLASPNPNYGNPTRFQPPMAARLGLTVNF